MATEISNLYSRLSSFAFGGRNSKRERTQSISNDTDANADTDADTDTDTKSVSCYSVSGFCEPSSASATASALFEESQKMYKFQIVFSPTLVVQKRGLVKEVPFISTYIYNRSKAMDEAKKNLSTQNYLALQETLLDAKPFLSRASLDAFNMEYKHVFINNVFPKIPAGAFAFLTSDRDSGGSEFVKEYKGSLIIQMHLLKTEREIGALLENTNVYNFTKVQMYNTVKTALMRLVQIEMDKVPSQPLYRDAESIIKYKMHIDVPLTILLDKTLAPLRQSLLAVESAAEYPVVLDFENIIHHPREIDTHHPREIKTTLPPPPPPPHITLFNTAKERIKRLYTSIAPKSPVMATTTTPAVPVTTTTIIHDAFREEYTRNEMLINATQKEMQKHKAIQEKAIAMIEKKFPISHKRKTLSLEDKVAAVLKYTFLEDVLAKTAPIPAEIQTRLEKRINDIRVSNLTINEGKKNIKRTLKAQDALLKKSKNPRAVQRAGIIARANGY
jgi:hypothetical protein